MGGLGSGRSGGKPTADMSCRIEIDQMIRKRQVIPGARTGGTLSWSCGGHPFGSISYSADLCDPADAWLTLNYTRGSRSDKEAVCQRIQLMTTQPNYGGVRWWMICPYRHRRCLKLYLPGGGDRFASRHAWRLGYNSQRRSAGDRASEALFRLQRKLGCEQGWEQPLKRPKGMWRRTFERHEDRYWQLDEVIGAEMAMLMFRLTR